MLVLFATACSPETPSSPSPEVVRVVTIQSDPAPRLDYRAPAMLYWVKSVSGERAWLYAESSHFPTGSCVEVHASAQYRVSMLLPVDESRCAGIPLDRSSPQDQPFGDADVPQIEFH